MKKTKENHFPLQLKDLLKPKCLYREERVCVDLGVTLVIKIQ